VDFTFKIKQMATEENKAAGDPGNGMLEKIIQRFYLADNSLEPEELLSHSDILRSVRTVRETCSGDELLIAMDSMGYPSLTVDGQLYWKVKVSGK